MTNRILILALTALLLGGCASNPDANDPTAGKSVSEIYQDAKEQLNLGNYEEAIKLYEKLESRYPYGNYATRSQLEIVYAYYKFEEMESAIQAADRFIKLHPQDPHVDYAYYMRGLASYNADKTWVQEKFNQEPSERDPKQSRRSFQYFADLLKKYPKSRYTTDSIQRMTKLRNNLAEYEVHVANYYLKRGAFLAAANRAKYVVENYQRAPAINDALAVMVKAYRELKLDDLAKDAQRVLEANQPDHPFLQSEHEQKPAQVEGVVAPAMGEKKSDEGVKVEPKQTSVDKVAPVEKAAVTTKPTAIETKPGSDSGTATAKTQDSALPPTTEGTTTTAKPGNEGTPAKQVQGSSKTPAPATTKDVQAQ